MALYRALPFVQHILKRQLHPQAFVIDATIGNGHDTRNIANLLSRSGKLFGFDIQQRALDNTAAHLAKVKVQCAVQLFQQSHATMLPTLERYVNKIDCVLFNLGYLPNGDEALTTLIDTTYSAILQALALLKPKGVLIIVTYPGHANGLIEHQRLIQLFSQADPMRYFITTYQQVNNKHDPPHVFLLEKRKNVW